MLKLRQIRHNISMSGSSLILLVLIFSWKWPEHWTSWGDNITMSAKPWRIGGSIWFKVCWAKISCRKQNRSLWTYGRRWKFLLLLNFGSEYNTVSSCYRSTYATIFWPSCPAVKSSGLTIGTCKLTWATFITMMSCHTCASIAIKVEIWPLGLIMQI